MLISNQGAIAELVHYSEHHVRAIIQEFNAHGLKTLEPKPRPGRPGEGHIPERTDFLSTEQRYATGIR